MTISREEIHRRISVVELQVRGLLIELRDLHLAINFHNDSQPPEDNPAQATDSQPVTPARLTFDA